MSLGKILHPLEPSRFFDEHWGKRSLLLPGARDRFADLFSSRKIGQLLYYQRPKPPDGMALVKVRPYGSGFLIFSDYARGALRLSALMELPVIHVFTHDSIGVGEDGIGRLVDMTLEASASL